MENFLYFYLYFLLCGCGLAVILARNPVQSVLFLILVFLLVAFIFMLLGAEFLAILLIIVYVGAISILFLFVVMMLNLRVVELHSTFYNYFPISILIGLLFFVEICYFLIIDFGNLTLSKFQGSNALFL
jgi:NADH-quinone oxidoreductase subunit J